MIKRLKIYPFILGMLLLAGCTGREKASAPKMNVLFIAVDDLRPELNVYGHSQMVTPHFDRLAEQGLVFDRAYCQQAVCAPSRNSLLTGLRPDALNIYDLGTFFRKTVPDVVTLPQHFKTNGYHTESIGKIYHVYHGNSDDSLSWSVPSWDYRPYRDQYRKITRNDTSGIEGPEPAVGSKRIPWYASEYPDEHQLDYGVASRAIERLETLKDQPFFLAVGFFKPHLPFIAPQKYWDLYPTDEVELPSADPPTGAPNYAMTRFGELRKYHGIPAEGPLSKEQAVQMIRGYRASVSFIDVQLGRLLDALERLDLARNTIIVLWGDHGWKLGEYGSWCKHTNFEWDTRSVLMVSTPGMLAKGQKTRSLTEFIDIYPTLCELAELPLPGHLQGQSLATLLDHPEQSLKKAALSQYPKNRKALMGYSLRTDRYRLVSWRDLSHRTRIHENELYDHQSDPGETINLAGDPQYDSLVQALNTMLDQDYLRSKETADMPLDLARENLSLSHSHRRGNDFELAKFEVPKEALRQDIRLTQKITQVP